MGKNSSKPDIDQLKNRFDIVSRDETNNLTYLRERRTRKHYMLKQIFANDESSIKNIQSELTRKKQLYHEHVAQLKEFYINLNEQFCSRMYSSGALYELPMRTLEDERRDRATNRVPFEENELWSIVASAILGFSYLQRNYIQHQSVRSSNIYVEDSGIIKIADPSAKQLPTNYELYRQSKNTVCVYLSPAQLRSFREQHKYAVHNPYKSDVFALGIVILEMAFLEEQRQIYSRNRGILNEQVLKERLDRFGKTYGEELKSVLIIMTNINEHDRLDWTQLQSFVKAHDKTEPQQKIFLKQQTLKQSEYKPSTAEFKPSTANYFSEKPIVETKVVPQRQQFSPAQYLSPASGCKHRRENAVVHFQTPENRSVSGSTTPIQQQKQDILQKMPTGQRVARISEPPMRLPQESNFFFAGLHTPARPPTQHNPHIVSLFQPHEQPSFQQPFHVPSINNSQLNQTVQTVHTVQSNYQQRPNIQQSRTINTLLYPLASQTSQNQHKERLHIPTQQRPLIPPSPTVLKFNPPALKPIIQLKSHHHSQYQPAQQTKARERHSYELTGNTSQSQLKQTSAQIVRKVNFEHPTFENVGGPSTVKTANVVSVFETQPNQLQISLHSPSEKKWQNSQGSNSHIKSTSTIEKVGQTVALVEPLIKKPPIQAITLLPMEQSYVDAACCVQGLLEPTYELKTKNDENIIEQDATSNEQHSFFSESEYRSQKRAVTVTYGATQEVQFGANRTNNDGNSHKSRQSNPSNQNNCLKLPSNTSSMMKNRQIQVRIQLEKGSQSQTPTTLIISPPTFYKKHTRQSGSKSDRKFVNETYKQGSRYEGQKYKGMRHGKGRFYYDDGGMYEGMWNMNRMEGFGKLYYVNGQIAYEGNWLADHFEGHGKLYNEKSHYMSRYDYRDFDDIEDYWKTYEGEFNRDLKHGRGVLVLENGQRYEGSFSDDMVHGEGVWKGKDGFVRGIWEHNHLIKVLN